MERDDGLRWFHDKGPDTWRGFCATCGASLFWDMGELSNRLSVAAGTLDDSDSLTTLGHIYLSESGGYYDVQDGLPQFEKGSDGHLEES